MRLDELVIRAIKHKPYRADCCVQKTAVMRFVRVIVPVRFEGFAGKAHSLDGNVTAALKGGNCAHQRGKEGRSITGRNGPGDGFVAAAKPGKNLATIFGRMQPCGTAVIRIG